ncbi:hypothetical protein ABEV54_18300 [Peribacillus psychrosaccharolyticus]|uniref:hypothetical protein n=1 Tax=Peribacillus psychrosaccharolyticus TaxID=1407 RepID=UPI003D2B2056
MIIRDNGQEYDSEYIEAAIAKGDDRDSIQRDILNMFSRFAYYRYHQIRSLLTTRKCKKLSIEQVRERLDIDKIQAYLALSEEEINYFINFVEKNIKIIS